MTAGTGFRGSSAFGRRWATAGLAFALAALPACLARGADEPEGRRRPLTEEEKQTIDRALKDSEKGPRLRLPPEEALAGAATVEGALALWGVVGPVLGERAMMAEQQVRIRVAGVLNGARMTVANARTDPLRCAALAQIQAACAVCLTTAGISFTEKERDLIAAYAARVGETRASAEEKGAPLPRR